MTASTKVEWRKTAVEGLYECRPAGITETARGVNYSRYSINGKRTFRSLATNVLEHAEMKTRSGKPMSRKTVSGKPLSGRLSSAPERFRKE